MHSQRKFLLWEPSCSRRADVTKRSVAFRTCSLPLSQQPAAWPHPEPFQHAPRLPNRFKAHLLVGVASDLIPSSFPTKILCASLVPHAQPIAFFIWSPERYLMTSATHEIHFKKTSEWLSQRADSPVRRMDQPLIPGNFVSSQPPDRRRVPPNWRP